ncbi:asparagine synthase C-terminal domain-containing protein [Thermoflavimicrobium daqui]|uniref:asparagine synthase-related protein n=1 Tax=Thermoflavimicrobium daqui TaxID=2137476 RepID=UPI001980BC49|nr:asparagine synthase C-terminal domain-containing protein [Thermoflavimicrobium daqui]
MLHILRNDQDDSAIKQCLLLIKSNPHILKDIEGAFVLALFDSESQMGILYKSFLCKYSVYIRKNELSLDFSTKVEDLIPKGVYLIDCIDPEVILSICLGERINSNQSYFNEIQRVSNGCILFYDKGEVSLRQIDCLKENQHKYRSLNCYIDTAREIMKKTVKQRIKDEDKITVVLSGGMDSSSILSFLNSMNVPVQAVHWKFNGVADESFFSRKVASYENVSYTEIDTEEMICSSSYIPEWNYELPYNHGYFPMFEQTLQVLQQSGSNKLATGYLGDDIFGSYSSDISIRSLFAQLPFKQSLRYIYEALGTPHISDLQQRYPRLHWYNKYLTQNAIERIDAKHYSQFSLKDHFMSYSNLEIDSLLENYYVQNGVHSFHLFHSKELMEWSLSLPMAYKLFPSGGQWIDKIVLRTMFLNILPKECIRRNYKPVMTNFHEKYVIHNKNQILSILSEESHLHHRGIIDANKILKMDNESMAIAASGLITCCMTEVWLQGLSNRKGKDYV